MELLRQGGAFCRLYARTAVGNIGLAAANRRDIAIGIVAGLMFIALAFVPKLTGAITLMPGAGLLYTACFLVISGVELIVSRLLDWRRTFIVGLSLLAETVST